MDVAKEERKDEVRTVKTGSDWKTSVQRSTAKTGVGQASSSGFTSRRWILVMPYYWYFEGIGSFQRSKSEEARPTREIVLGPS